MQRTAKPDSSPNVTEDERLELLRGLEILDSPPEDVFNDLVRLAAQSCSTPIATLTFLDERRQWFKARVGLELQETPRQIAFCRHAIAGREVFEVRDALLDVRFSDNPLVLQSPKLRFYAGFPLQLAGGVTVGTLGVMDTQPRHLTDGQRRALESLGRQAVALLEARRRFVELRHSVVERVTALANRREEEFRSAFESAPQGIVVVDLEGKIVRSNRAFEHMLGYDSSSLVGESLVTLSQDEAPSTFQKAITPLLEGRLEMTQLERRYRCRDGSSRHLLVDVAPIRDARGSVVRLVLHVDDVTELRQARMEAEQAERRLVEERALSDRIVDSLPGIFYLLDDRGRILRWNRNVETLTGYASQEIAGRSAVDFFADADRPLIEERIGEVFSAGKADIQADLVHKDGSTTPCYFTGQTFDCGGRTCLIGMGIDISARRELEDQLRQLQKMESVGQLAAGVAHDFNNLLTVIQGHASLLLDGEAGASEIAELGQEISDAAQRAANLTRQLLLFSRKQHMEPELVELGELTHNLAKMLRRVLGEQVALELDTGSEPAEVVADPGMLEQVITNLAVNARDAMPVQGTLSIEIAVRDLSEKDVARSPEARPGRFVVLTVRDTGTGIPPEVLPRVCEPFFTTKETGKGTGLGLATVYGIIDQHEGWMEIESEVGRGTTVRCFLPRRTRKPKQPEASEVSTTLGGTETVMLVEDEPALRNLAQKILSRRGYTVVTAGSGPEALQRWDEHRGAIDLLVTDMVMPGGIQGPELAERLRAEKPNLAVVLTSGYSAEVATELSVGSSLSYLPKPFDPSKLLETVRRALEQRGSPARS